jgi:hypothetical protein
VWQGLKILMAKARVDPGCIALLPCSVLRLQAAPLFCFFSASSGSPFCRSPGYVIAWILDRLDI